MGKRATKVTKTVKKVRVVYLYIDGAEVAKDEIQLHFFSLSEDLLAEEIERKTHRRGIVIDKIIEVSEKYELPLHEFMASAQLVFAEDGRVHAVRIGGLEKR